MPKMKTNRAAAKRFKVTKSGKIKRSRAYTRHLKTGKSAKRRRNLRKAAVLTSADHKRIKEMLPYA